MTAYMILANGFEEIEATYTIALLRDAGVNLKTVSISSSKEICSSHDVSLFADLSWDECDIYDGDALILPGGQPGTDNLALYKPLEDVIVHYLNNKIVAAICAAPSILGDLGLLNGRTVTCYPDYEDKLKGAIILRDSVVIDNNLITSRGAGTAADFAFAIARKMADPSKVKETENKFYGNYVVE